VRNDKLKQLRDTAHLGMGIRDIVLIFRDFNPKTGVFYDDAESMKQACHWCGCRLSAHRLRRRVLDAAGPPTTLTLSAV